MSCSAEFQQNVADSYELDAPAEGVIDEYMTTLGRLTLTT